MNLDRVRTLNSEEGDKGTVMYWMNRDMRLHDNWAYIHTQEQARLRKTSLFIVYNLVPNYLGGGLRQWDFKIKALQQTAAECKRHNIPFIILIDHQANQTSDGILSLAKENSASLIVTDFCPLKSSRTWTDQIRKHAECQVDGVDAHNIVPVWKASLKQEFGAYTLRPKLHKLLPTYLDDFPEVEKQSTDNLQAIALPKNTAELEFINTAICAHSDWNALLNIKGIGEIPQPVDWCVPGELSAREVLQHFLDEKLVEYAQQRNDPNKDAQSNLSPYLHYGNISAQRIVLDALKHEGKSVSQAIYEKKNGSKDGSGIEAFLEEVIVRRELSDNFCFYNESYDNFKGAPEWAKETLRKAREDKREFLYTKKQFENAETHDDLWNAAQLEMVKHGKMSGYMRMYWAKKILQWTISPEEAIKIAMYLNDKYEIDGRDPNGYVGIMWSITGLHDRAWFSRPVFGAIRYMARSGCEKKFNVKAYIEKWKEN